MNRIHTNDDFAMAIKRFYLPAIVAWLLHLSIFTVILLGQELLMNLFTAILPYIPFAPDGFRETNQIAVEWDVSAIFVPLILGLLLGLWLVKKHTRLADTGNLR